MSEITEESSKNKIKIYGNYYILVDQLNVTAMVTKTGVNKKTKEPSTTEKLIGYYGTLENALIGIVNYISREKLAQKGTVKNLQEAIIVIQESNKLLIDLLKVFAYDIGQDDRKAKQRQIDLQKELAKEFSIK